MTAGQSLDKAEAVLKSRRVPEARASAEILMAHILGLSRNAVFLERGRKMSRREQDAFARLVAHRARRVPIAHILGEQPFLDFTLAASPQALIPRPETEELAEAVMQALKSRRAQPLRAWDLGTGTGCLAVALARFFPKARGLATDKSAAALALARRNARKNGVAGRVVFRQDDFFTPRPRGRARPEAWADLVVSNPPYIPSRRIAALAPEVRREPRLALDGGKTGLDAIAAVVERASEALKPGGVLALEFGWNQARRVVKLLGARGFSRVEIRRDAQGLDRIALARARSEHPKVVGSERPKPTDY